MPKGGGGGSKGSSGGSKNSGGGSKNSGGGGKSAPSMSKATGGASMASRAAAVSRGPGVLNSPRNEAIARTTAFREGPAGLRAPALGGALSRAALNNQSLFSMSRATPAQQRLVDQIAPSALHVSMTTGLDPRTVLGQAITESTTGRHSSKVSGLARNANNLFGVKGTGRQNEFWDGSVVRMPTNEYFNGRKVTIREPFRQYQTPNQSVLDYGNLINRRYSNAADSPTVAGQLSAIRGGGYATHPSASYVSIGVRNANRLSPGGAMMDDPGNTQVAGVGNDAAAAVARQTRRNSALETLARPLTAPHMEPMQGPRRPDSFIGGDPRLNMAPGSFPPAQRIEPMSFSQPERQVAWNTPPMGGALPSDIGTALGVWSTTRTPPAAPHQGTIHSQTVQADSAPSIWQRGSAWMADKTQAAVQAQQKFKQAVDTHGPDAVATYLQQKTGQMHPYGRDPQASRESREMPSSMPSAAPAPIAPFMAPPAPPEPPPVMWQFPQYTQSWAFTPPQGSFPAPRPPQRRV